MSESKFSVYVGMALTGAPEEFRVTLQNDVKRGLREIPGVKVWDFVGLTGSTEVDVYETDRLYAERADLVVFICDHPSTGLGMEIAFRHATRKPMILAAKMGAVVTRMVTGFAKREDIPLRRYEYASDIVALAKRRIEQLLEAA